MIGILSFMYLSSKGQLAVTAPALETMTAQNASVQSIIQSTVIATKALQKKINDLREAAGWLGTIQATQELIDLMEAYECLALDYVLDFDRALELMGPRASCFNEFKYTAGLGKAQYAVDLLNQVLTPGFNMDQGDRIRSVGEISDAWRESMGQMADHQNILRRTIRKSEREDDLRVSYQDLLALMSR